ncbi:S41 family peptidase [Sulfurihydrogenibium azorense]|jgi:carboxyl-terminal processing protease|uniref:Carboxy-peptidase n=1 Tax=Sulfurihydrogenibium azorense (strain DSM 15241 / OCM 825 / Az-Fu1) TaxID=204536 RepID=C1DTL7_SULAA|nr:S41 family peptidase [Sulfurihydrogenibium azorense]ACN98219.1 carboxy- peptidase [Sulfurihydrogenibium azorense Az-Fu1]MDM7273651.1 S41 family peptidase [Sulfurihydrogenibium azorense]
MKSRISMVVGVILIFVAGMSFGLNAKTPKTDYSEDIQIIRTYTDVLKLVEDNYVEPTDPKKLLYGSLRGLLSSLDPYSTFFTPEEFKEFTSETQGEFGGLGMEVTMENNKLLVVSPIEDTPAFKAGIKPGDWIVEIDGEPTDKMTLFQAVKKMRGKPGTKVTLTIFRKGVEKPFKVELVRDLIKVKSVKTKELENGKIGYIRLTQFQENSAEEFEKALKSFKNKEGIIIDLRNNPGGLLTSAVSIADMLLPKGKLIVYTQGRDPKNKEEFYSQSEPVVDKKIPIAVIVNKGSASASEILTGALKDNNRAIIVGDTTFGKASVQTLIPLPDGSGVKLTVAHYYTPNGNLIMNKGITPDIIVKVSEEEEAERAKAEREAKMNGKEVEIKDPQLEAAINAIKILNFAKKLN